MNYVDKSDDSMVYFSETYITLIQKSTLDKWQHENKAMQNCKVRHITINSSHEHNFYYGRSRNLWRGIMARYGTVLRFLVFLLHFICSELMMS